MEILVITKKKKTMEETKFKKGDVVRIKSLDWYNKNKNENGDVKVTDYFCYFSKELSKFCGKCFVINKIEGTSFYLNNLSYTFYEWMFEPGKYELKLLNTTKSSFEVSDPFVFNAAKMPISVYGVVSTPLYIAVKVQEAPKFQPFQKVLVKDCEEGIFGVWHCDLFSHISKEGKYFTISGEWENCIPFEGNEHLIGTKDDPKER